MKKLITKTHLFFVISISIFTINCSAMEVQKYDDHIFIQCTDDVVQTTRAGVQKLETIRSYLEEFNQGELPSEKLKWKIKKYLPRKMNPEIIIDLDPLNVKKDSLEKLLTLAESINENTEDENAKKLINTNISITNAVDIFNAANKLNVDSKISGYFARFIREKIPLHQLSQETQKIIDFEDSLFTIQDYISKSSKDIILSKVINNREFNRNKKETLELSNMNLSSIDGINSLADLLAEKKETIRVLILANNKLKRLELERIVRAFPNIKEVAASGNKITKLTASDMNAIKDGMTLNLENNKLKKIAMPLRITPFGCHYHLSENYLNPKQCEQLKSYLKPTKRQILSRKFSFKHIALIQIGALFLFVPIYAFVPLVFAGAALVTIGATKPTAKITLGSILVASSILATFHAWDNILSGLSKDCYKVSLENQKTDYSIKKQ